MNLVILLKARPCRTPWASNLVLTIATCGKVIRKSKFHKAIFQYSINTALCDQRSAYYLYSPPCALPPELCPLRLAPCPLRFVIWILDFDIPPMPSVLSSQLSAYSMLCPLHYALSPSQSVYFFSTFGNKLHNKLV